MKLTRVPSPTVEVESAAVAVALDVGQAHAGAEAQRARLGRGRRPALAHGVLDVGDAGALVDDVDVELAVVTAGLEAPAAGVDDDVHLGLVGGDHGAAHGVALGADALEVLLEVARGGARLAEVAAVDVVGQVLHELALRPAPTALPPARPQRLVDEAAGLEHAQGRDHQRVPLPRLADHLGLGLDAVDEADAGTSMSSATRSICTLARLLTSSVLSEASLSRSLTRSPA